MKLTPLAVALSLSTLALASWSTPSGVPRYRVEVVGGPDPVARETYGLAMNNLGQVTGYSRFDDPDRFHYGSAFLYSNHTLQQIAPLSQGTSRGFGINDRGEIVGSFNRDGDAVPYLYRNGHVIELAGNLLPAWGGEARAINQAGQVVGSLSNGRSFIYENGHSRFLLGPSERSNAANAINERGVVAGEIFTGCCSFEGYVYSDGSLRHLPTLGGGYSTVLALNNAGEMVGYSWTRGDEDRQAVLYRGNTITPLTVPGGFLGQANDINESGWVVGSSAMREGSDIGFLYRDGHTYDLNGLLWGNAAQLRHITEAVAINEAGQILVHSRNNTPWRSSRTLILTPVPEPSSWALLLAGLAAVGGAARRRRG